jgi:1-acyl-sn-glycerol-3-phosphate acyltransferase
MKAPNVIRGLWFLPYFGMNTCLLGMLSLIVSLWSVKGSRWFARFWAKINAKAAGVTLKVEGLENLPLSSPNGQAPGMIIAANHSSAADIGAVLCGLPLDICWVTKASLIRVPFLGWHLQRVHIPVERKKAGNTQKFLDAGAKKIRDGAAVVIFPEGTRNQGAGDLLPFKKGAFLLAKASGRPVIPLAIIDSEKIWPPKTLLPMPGSITMRIGAAIDLNDFPEDRLDLLAEKTREAIRNLLVDGMST